MARGAPEEAHHRRYNETIAAIQRTGEAFFGGTTWRHARQRLQLATSDEDVERVLKTVASVLTSNR